MNTLLNIIDINHKQVTYVNHGKDAIIFNCKEKETNREFKMKLIDTGKNGEIILYYGGLNTQERPIDFKRHKIIQLDSQVLDYITRLISGKVCGLFLGDHEDHSFSVSI